MSEPDPSRDEPLWSVAQALAWIRWRNPKIDRDFAGPKGSEFWRQSLSYDPAFLPLPSKRDGRDPGTATADLLRMSEEESSEIGGPNPYEEYDDPAAKAPVDALLDKMRSGALRAKWRVTEDAPLSPMPASEWTDLSIGTDARPCRRHSAGKSVVGSAVFVVKHDVHRFWPRRSKFQDQNKSLEEQGEAELRELLADPATAHLSRPDILRSLSIGLTGAAKGRIWKKAMADFPERAKPGPKRRSQAGPSS